MGISTEMLVYEDMTSCTDLARCHVVDEIATVLPSNVSCSKYFLDKRCFL